MPTVAFGSLQLGFLPGLSNEYLSLLLLGVAALVFLWGFERYRTTFSRVEFGLAVAVALGLASVALAPGIYGTVANALDIESRFLVVQVLTNAVFVFLILYLVSQVYANRTLVNDLTRGLTVQQAALTEDAAPDGDAVYVVIPAYNEADTIGSVVESLPEQTHGYDVEPIVVCDGSADDTAHQARTNGAMVVKHHVNQGQGGALKTGFEVAIENDAAIVVTMDADGQHPAEELETLIEPIVQDRADYVMGSRYLGVDQSGNGTVREAGIQFFTRAINVLTKSSITDCTNGYRAIRGTMLADLTLTEERFSAPELIIEARKQGLRIEEIPVTIEERDAGESKKPQLGYAFGLSRTILMTWIR